MCLLWPGDAASADDVDTTSLKKLLAESTIFATTTRKEKPWRAYFASDGRAYFLYADGSRKEAGWRITAAKVCFTFGRAQPFCKRVSRRGSGYDWIDADSGKVTSIIVAIKSGDFARSAERAEPVVAEIARATTTSSPAKAVRKVQVFPQTDHGAPILCLLVNDDRSFLVSWDGDDVIKIWNLANGRLWRALRAPSGWGSIESVSMAPNRQYLFVTYGNYGEGTLVAAQSFIYRLSDESLTEIPKYTERRNPGKFAYTHEYPLNALFSDDSRHLLVFTISIDRDQNDKAKRVFSHGAKVYAIKDRQDKPHASALKGRQGDQSRFAAQRQRIQRAVSRLTASSVGRVSHESEETAHVFKALNAPLATCGTYDLEKGQTPLRLRISRSNQSPPIRIETKANRLLLDVGDPAGTDTRAGVAVSGGTPFAALRDGRSLATGHSDGSVRLWDLENGRLKHSIDAFKGPVTDIAAVVSGNRQPMAIATSKGREGRIIDFGSGESTPIRDVDGANPERIDIDKSGRTALLSKYTTYKDGQDYPERLPKFSILDLADANRIRVSPSLGEYCNSACAGSLSGDGKYVAFDGGFYRNSARFERLKKFYGDDKDRRCGNAGWTQEFTSLQTGSLSVHFFGDGAEEATGFIDLRRVPDGARVGCVPEVYPGKERNYIEGGSALGLVTNEILAIGNVSGRLQLIRLPALKPLATQSIHKANVEDISRGLADGRVVTSAADGSIAIWRWSESSARLQPVVRLYAAPKGEWLIMTPEGFFASSPRGAALLNVVRGFEVFGADRIYQALYRPDLVREKLAGDPNGKVRDAAERLDLDRVVNSGPAPEVAIISPKDGARVSESKPVFEARLTDRGGGVGRLEWRVNGVTLGIEERGLERIDNAPQGGTRIVRRALSLEPGKNTIEAVAYNAKNLIASNPARVTLVSTVDVSSTPPRLYVLVVGVNDYWDSRLRLKFAASDARSMGAALKKAGRNFYERVEVIHLLDTQVTASGLDRAFQKLGQQIRARDVFVFFLAGHGKTVDGRYYFIPQNFRYANERSIVEDGIGQDKWQSWFSRISARKSILLYDTCESGSLTGDRIQTRGLERVAALDRLNQAVGRTILSAATDDTPALEGYRAHGVFTYAVLDALARSDGNGNDLIELTELAGHVDATVPEISYKSFGFRQVPQMRLVGSNFPLAKRTVVLTETEPAPATTNPIKPTHVVIQHSEVFSSPAREGASISRLQPGTGVTLLVTERGWVLVARDGKKLGYVEKSRLVPLR
ncbi:MAG: caspase family protein [Methyloligellaceae bacterium]